MILSGVDSCVIVLAWSDNDTDDNEDEEGGNDLTSSSEGRAV